MTKFLKLLTLFLFGFMCSEFLPLFQVSQLNYVNSFDLNLRYLYTAHLMRLYSGFHALDSRFMMKLIHMSLIQTVGLDQLE